MIGPGHDLGVLKQVIDLFAGNFSFNGYTMLNAGAVEEFELDAFLHRTEQIPLHML